MVEELQSIIETSVFIRWLKNPGFQQREYYRYYNPVVEESRTRMKTSSLQSGGWRTLDYNEGLWLTIRWLKNPGFQCYHPGSQSGGWRIPVSSRGCITIRWLKNPGREWRTLAYNPVVEEPRIPAEVVLQSGGWRIPVLPSGGWRTSDYNEDSGPKSGGWRTPEFSKHLWLIIRWLKNPGVQER